MRTLIKDRRGNFSLIFALSVVPIFGAAGLAVDYTRAIDARSYFQDLADHAALSGALESPTGDTSKIIDFAKTTAEAAKGHPFKPTDVVVTDQWVSSQDYKVTITGKIATTLLSGLPGFPSTVDIGASATAQAGEPQYTYQQPEYSWLDPSAYDYDQIAVYCYNAKTGARTQEVTIADNAGLTYNYTIPTCAAGETLSYHMHNVQLALHNAENNYNSRKYKNWTLQQKIAAASQGAATYDYYTDTQIVGGIEEYPGLKEPMLETVLCDTKAECTPSDPQSIIPEGSNRTPEHQSQACEPGKYLYYGWEDRQPSQGSDEDYNDIRVVMACPDVTITGYSSTRLIQ